MTATTKPMSFTRFPLNEILAGPGSVRVLRALLAHGGVLSVSRLAADTKLTPNGTRKVLGELELSGVVESIGDSRVRLYRASVDHPLTAALKDLFAAEERRLDNTIAMLKRATADRRIIAAWLFGSVARAEDTRDSDLDLAIVVDADRAKVDEVADRVRTAAANIGGQMGISAISIVGLHLPDLRQIINDGSQLWKDLLRDAHPIKGPRPRLLEQRLQAAAEPVDSE